MIQILLAFSTCILCIEEEKEIAISEKRKQTDQ